MINARHQTQVRLARGNERRVDMGGRRRTSVSAPPALNSIDSAALHGFDLLPASAHVRLPVVAVLFGISPATVWRWSKSGLLPKPTRLNGITFWEVGALRQCPARRDSDDRL